MNQPIVIKRDGTEEAFEKNKIERVIKAAGLAPDKALVVANNVEKWTQENNLPKFTSLELRDEIYTQLQQIDENIANLYQWYEGTKDQKSEETA